MIVKSRYKVIFFILLMFSFSCQDLKKTEKPEDLIPEDKMIDVLTEMSLMYAARNYNKQKLENTGIKPDEYIYERFDIDSLQFERSNNYYAEQYNQYERMYDSVKLRIQVLKTRLDSIREVEVKIEDSIKKAKKDSIKAVDSVDVDSIKVDSLKLKSTGDRTRAKDSLAPPVKFGSTSEDES